MDDNDPFPRLKQLLGEHGFAQLEAFAEALHKNPPTEEQYHRYFDKLKREIGFTEEDAAAIREDLFGPKNPQ
jgi:uncharacterized protein YbcC (UPF0753/DUF2309 family)